MSYRTQLISKVGFSFCIVCLFVCCAESLKLFRLEVPVPVYFIYFYHYYLWQLK